MKINGPEYVRMSQYRLHADRIQHVLRDLRAMSKDDERLTVETASSAIIAEHLKNAIHELRELAEHLDDKIAPWE